LLDKNAPDEQRLLSVLLSHYEPATRPVLNASDVVAIRFGLTLAQISDMVYMAFFFRSYFPCSAQVVIFYGLPGFVINIRNRGVSE